VGLGVFLVGYASGMLGFVITLARKPLPGTVVETVLDQGAGALHIEATRIPTEDALSGGAYAEAGSHRHDGTQNWRYERQGGAGDFVQPSGRWPANVVYTREPQSGDDQGSKFFLVVKG